MKLGVVVGLALLAACSACAMGGCAGETVVAVYGGSDGSGEGGGYYGGSSPDGWGGYNVGANDLGGSPPEGPNCYDQGTAFSLNTDNVGPVEIDQDLCTAQQITDVFAACIGQGSSQKLCDAFEAADPSNTACLGCVVGSDTVPFPMPVTIAVDMYQYLSYYACAAQVANLPECEVPFQSLVFCGKTACQSCDQEDDEKSNECLNWAINDPETCAMIEVPDTCMPLFDATELPAECIGAATTFAAAFPILADFYCGAP